MARPPHNPQLVGCRRQLSGTMPARGRGGSSGKKRPRRTGASAAAEGGGGWAIDTTAAMDATEVYRRLQDVIKRATAPPSTKAGEGGGQEQEEAVDLACWAELKLTLKGGSEEAAGLAFTLLLGQLRDRRVGVRACVRASCGWGPT